MKQFSPLAFCTVTPEHPLAGKAIIRFDCQLCSVILLSTNIRIFVLLLSYPHSVRIKDLTL